MNDIDWENLKTHFGSGEKLPDFIQGLFSQGTDVRERSLFSLREALCHQGTICEDAHIVIPVLLELLTQSNFPAKNGIVQILLCFAPVEVEFYDQSDEYEVKAYEAITQGINIFLDLLNSEEDYVRLSVSTLLSRAGLFSRNHGSKISDALYNRILIEEVPDARVVIIYNLGEFLAHGKQFLLHLFNKYIKVFQQLWLTEADYQVRIAAALSIPKLQEADTPSDVITYLIDEAADITFDYPTNKSIGFQSVRRDQHAIISLSYLGFPKRIPALAKAVEKANNGEKKIVLANCILGWAFSGWRTALICEKKRQPNGKLAFEFPKVNKPYTGADFTQEQKQALEALLAIPDLWQIESNLLASYGLPTDPEEIKKLLQ